MKSAWTAKMQIADALIIRMWAWNRHSAISVTIKSNNLRLHDKMKQNLHISLKPGGRMAHGSGKHLFHFSADPHTRATFSLKFSYVINNIGHISYFIFKYVKPTDPNAWKQWRGGVWTGKLKRHNGLFMPWRYSRYLCQLGCVFISLFVSLAGRISSNIFTNIS